MSDDQFRQLCNVYGFAPSRALRELIDCAVSQATLAKPVQQGCDHCNQPLYVAVKCRVCGRVTEPVQEPVAWIHTDPDKPNVKFLEWRENEPGYRGSWIKTPLYTIRG